MLVSSRLTNYLPCTFIIWSFKFEVIFSAYKYKWDVAMNFSTIWKCLSSCTLSAGFQFCERTIILAPLPLLACCRTIWDKIPICLFSPRASGKGVGKLLAGYNIIRAHRVRIVAIWYSKGENISLRRRGTMGPKVSLSSSSFVSCLRSFLRVTNVILYYLKWYAWQ